MSKEFDLEHQYQLYLERVALTEKNMHPDQKKQLRQTFMGACGQMLLLLRDDLGKLPEPDGMKVYKHMIDQVGNYFLNKKGQQN